MSLKKSSILEDLHGRLKKLEEKPEEKEEDDTVCPECGEDLFEIEEGIYYCERCDQGYEPKN